MPAQPIVITKDTKEVPTTVTRSIFLAGPCLRKMEHGDRTWHDDALHYLASIGYDGHVFIPLPFVSDYVEGVHWEDTYLQMADVILFWVPRDMEKLPGFTTNIEFGEWHKSGKTVLGYPQGAPKMSYLDLKARENGVEVRNTLEETIDVALQMVGDGAERNGGEVYVPLHIWRMPGFQSWYVSQRVAGNTLQWAKLLWEFRMPIARKTFCWVLQVHVWIEEENRSKTNEFVFTRSDISTILAYVPADPTKGLPYLLDNTHILTVKEFRSPARTSDGYVHELPGGSSLKPGESPLAIASHELEEETGLVVDSGRFRHVGSRQLAATLTTHKSELFVVEITSDELASVVGKTSGVAADTEVTHIGSCTLREALNGSVQLDWSMVGMVMSGLFADRPVMDSAELSIMRVARSGLFGNS
jgi:8-oxo-dGTP pyrophosphatase MutT (NUDIX family)